MVTTPGRIKKFQMATKTAQICAERKGSQELPQHAWLPRHEDGNHAKENRIAFDEEVLNKGSNSKQQRRKAMACLAMCGKRCQSTLNNKKINLLRRTRQKT